MASLNNLKIIGFYDDSRNRAGTVRYLAEIINRLDRGRFVPVFFSPHSFMWQQELNDIDVEIVTLDKPIVTQTIASSFESVPNIIPQKRTHYRLPQCLAWWLGYGREIGQLVRLFKKRPVDLMHLNNTGAEAAPIAAKLAGIPRILGTWHVDSTYDLTGVHSTWNYRFLEKQSMKALHRAIAVSDATKQDWLDRCNLDECYADRVDIIYNGVDLSRLARRRSKEEAKKALGLNLDTIVIGSLGRLAPEKGYEYLIQAMPDILRQEPHAVVLIAGRGPLEASLKKLAVQLGVSESIHFVGFCEDVRDVLEAIDIYVQPSLCEAHCISILEAMAFSLPLIVSDAGGNAESVMNGNTGLVIPKHDSMELAKALISLIDNPELCHRMGAAGACRVQEHFTSERMATKTTAIYERMLKG